VEIAPDKLKLKRQIVYIHNQAVCSVKAVELLYFAEYLSKLFYCATGDKGAPYHKLHMIRECHPIFRIVIDVCRLNIKGAWQIVVSDFVLEVIDKLCFG